MRNNRVLTGAAIAVLALLMGAYLASPFFALSALAQGIRDDNRDEIAAEVDFPAVRASLKDQVDGYLEGRASDDRDLSQNPFGNVLLTLVPKIVDTVVDRIVTPDGIAFLLAQPLNVHRPHTEESDRGGAYSRSFVFTGIDDFRVRLTNRKDPTIVFGLVFERHGFSWRLARLELPIGELARRVSGNPS